MCGIYGYIGYPKNPRKVYELMKMLAVLSEVRGTDATGFFSIDREELTMEKSPVRAKEFVKTSKHMKDVIVNKEAYLFVGHNRWASRGDTSDVDNCHPFLGEKFIMVHNGTADEAFVLLQENGLQNSMEGATDSEAILRIVDKKGFTNEVLAELDDYSIVALNYETGQLHFARDNYKPMEVYDFRKQLGIRVFVSTRSIAMSAFNYCKIGYEHTKVFSTLPYHRYEVDMISGEFTNMGVYVEFEEPKVVYVPTKDSLDPNNPSNYHFGRRGYPAPTEKKYSNVGWSGGSID